LGEDPLEDDEEAVGIERETARAELHGLTADERL
jgi:hypothetical protein